MKQLLVIPMQSISDVVTNSSSEVFILNTDKTCEEVNNILTTFTRGFRYPEIFSLKDYRIWRKRLRVGNIEKSWDYPGSIFEIADQWFKDPKDEYDLFKLRENFLFDPYKIETFGTISYKSYDSSYQEPIHKDFVEYLNDNWDKVKDPINEVLKHFNLPSVDKIDWSTIRRYGIWIESALKGVTKEFLKNYNGPKPTVWEVPYDEDVTRLDGCVLVVSEDDNSIPYKTWDQIRETFNGWNIHLG